MATALKKMAKKAAKKAPKKAPKKAAKKAAKHGPGQDLRRAYEHISRVRILHLGLKADVLGQMETLTRMAQGALLAGDARSAADLLRGAEHMAFGSMASESADAGVSAELDTAARIEYERLLERAEEKSAERGRKPNAELRAIYEAMLDRADAAYGSRAFHRALEFARGATALMEAESFGPARLPPGAGAVLRLR